VAALRSLTAFKLQHCKGIREKNALAPLSNLTGLSDLNLSGCLNLQGGGISSLAPLTALRCLSAIPPCFHPSNAVLISPCFHPSSLSPISPCFHPSWVLEGWGLVQTLVHSCGFSKPCCCTVSKPGPLPHTLEHLFETLVCSSNSWCNFSNSAPFLQTLVHCFKPWVHFWGPQALLFQLVVLQWPLEGRGGRQGGDWPGLWACGVVEKLAAAGAGQFAEPGRVPPNPVHR
jgi:hypothetical protein